MSIAETSASRAAPYTPAAMEKVRQMATNHTDAAIARELGWPISSLRARCIRHGIHIAYEPSPKHIADVVEKPIIESPAIKPAPKPGNSANADLSPIAILARAGICWDVKNSELTSDSYAVTLSRQQALTFLRLLPTLCSYEFTTISTVGLARLRDKIWPFGLVIKSRRSEGWRLCLERRK